MQWMVGRLFPCFESLFNDGFLPCSRLCYLFHLFDPFVALVYPCFDLDHFIFSLYLSFGRENGEARRESVFWFPIWLPWTGLVSFVLPAGRRQCLEHSILELKVLEEFIM